MNEYYRTNEIQKITLVPKPYSRHKFPEYVFSCSYGARLS